MKSTKINFSKGFNLNTFAAKLLIIQQSFNREKISGTILEDKNLFDKWANEQCEQHFEMNNENEVKGCRVYLQGFLLNVEGNKFSQILNS